jgi:DNA primase
MEPKDEIKQKMDVAELVGEYLDLKPAGSGSFKAMCPFHQDGSPSFYVSTEKQIWHCFGCGEGGDVFSFVQQMEGMDFPEAMRHLGKKVGVEVKRFSSSGSQEKQRLQAINQLSANYFHKVLLDSTQAASARKYLEARGITEDLIQKFQLGFAIESWDALSGLLGKKGYQESEGIKAGVLLKSKRGHGSIDRFRNRVMVPLSDHHGNVVGFTGRIMPGADEKSGPKYMNSPETPLYHKSEVLYGLHLAKRAIKEQRQVIVVEGNLDVVASHKAGVENVVASSGTALTEQQITLLKRFTETIVFAMDADAAGLMAAKRGMRLAQSLGCDIRVVALPDDVNDPDDLVQKDADRWCEITQKTIPAMQFLIKKISEGKDLRTIDDKKVVAAELLPELSAMQNVVEREHWLQVIADLLFTDIKILRASLDPVQRQIMSEKKKEDAPKKRSTKEERIMTLLLGLFVQNEACAKQISDELAENDLEGAHKSLYSFLQSAYHNNQENFAQKSNFSRIRQELEREEGGQELVPLLDQSSLRAETFLTELSPTQVRVQIKSLFDAVRGSKLQARKKALEAKIRQAEMSGDTQQVEQLIAEYHKLT